MRISQKAGSFGCNKHPRLPERRGGLSWCATIIGVITPQSCGCATKVYDLEGTVLTTLLLIIG